MTAQLTTLGVSALVRLRVPILGHDAGAVGMVIGQARNGRFRYRVMFPGDPLAFSLTSAQVETLQGFDLPTEWVE